MFFLSRNVDWSKFEFVDLVNEEEPYYTRVGPRQITTEGVNTFVSKGLLILLTKSSEGEYDPYLVESSDVPAINNAIARGYSSNIKFAVRRCALGTIADEERDLIFPLANVNNSKGSWVLPLKTLSLEKAPVIIEVIDKLYGMQSRDTRRTRFLDILQTAVLKFGFGDMTWQAIYACFTSVSGQSDLGTDLNKDVQSWEFYLMNFLLGAGSSVAVMAGNVAIDKYSGAKSDYKQIARLGVLVFFVAGCWSLLNDIASKLDQEVGESASVSYIFMFIVGLTLFNLGGRMFRWDSIKDFAWTVMAATAFAGFRFFGSVPGGDLADVLSVFSGITLSTFVAGTAWEWMREIRRDHQLGCSPCGAKSIAALVSYLNSDESLPSSINEQKPLLNAKGESSDESDDDVEVGLSDDDTAVLSFLRSIAMDPQLAIKKIQ